MVTGINKSITLTKHISCKRKCKSNGRKCNSTQKWDNENINFENAKFLYFTCLFTD